MDEKTSVLDTIYEKVKAKREALTLDEFASKIGSSRASLFRYRKDPSLIPDGLIERAESLLGETKSGSRETYQEERLRKKNEDKEHTLLYYDVNASAGTVFSGEILPVNKNEGKLYISDLFKGSHYAVRLSGNSMIPSYPPGAIVGIKEIEDKQIIPGTVYVVQKGNDLWIKRLFFKDDNPESQTIECISDNTMKEERGARKGKLYYPPFYVDANEITKLFKVTGMFKSNELTVISNQ